ncbi:MAG: hypothetical protein KGK01_19335 [Bradyrhizobium sp.]|uniref:hypothetical protein n=1 Tax=Bradyrhizobium sp. TaxID=376 RepID=UPI001C28EA01|nr:hypothetical protein [Bradyrhizobium sp.]MBU6464107.1 hypothetical protein [Pseudomonadota bacterium]MDE2069122.1 hypothetical protein [Bradyrhizobium sp.]MDE2244494.1 hypothetical protein [Bradyrhizobium sp.]MDE2469567.1 hypothetical protein [Bradyrhizobium sp.]
MANERIPEDSHRPTFGGDETREPAVLDNKLQPDPGLAEGPASNGRIAIFAVGIAVVLGIVFYSLNTSSINHAGTSPTAQNAAPASPTQNTAQPPQTTAQTSPTASPPGDAASHPNTSPGVTTGASPAVPASQNRTSNPTTAPASK